MSAGISSCSVPHLESLDADSEGEMGERGALQDMRRELRHLAHLGWPVVLTQCLYLMIGTVAIIFAGHRGETELDVVAISTAVLDITAVAVAHGFSGYCDTLFSQVYGSKDKKRLGAVLQKCLLIMSVGICPSLALHINMRPLLQLIGYNSELARLTEQYLLIHIPGTIAVYFYIVLAKYVQNQNREIPILFIAGIGNAVNVCLHAVFLVWLETGVWGSAVSLCVTYVTLLMSTVIYIITSGIYKDTWQGWTCESFLSWAQYCKLGIYSLLIHIIERCALESGIFLSAILGPDLIAAQSIVFQFVIILYSATRPSDTGFGANSTHTLKSSTLIPWGIGMAGGIRVGQHLGANDPKSAKLSARITLGTAVTIGFFFFVLIVSLRDYLPLIYTNDKNIVDLVASALPIVGVIAIFDNLGGAMKGVLRGTGRQGVGAAVTIPAMIFVLVCGLTLMFKTSLNIKGFWLAFMCAIIFQASVGTIFLYRLNWTEEAETTQIRVRNSGGQMDNIYVITPKEDFIMNGIDNPAFNIGLGCETISVITTPPEEVTKKFPRDVLKNEAPALFTNKLVLCRVLTFGLSFGCLIIGLIIRNVVDISQFGLPGVNGTMMATYNMDNGTAMAIVYNGTVL